MKYNYDKSVLKGLSVGPFLAIDKTRDSKISAAPDTPPVSEFNANRLAKALHPKVQFAIVSKVIDHGSAKSFNLIPDPQRGTDSLAYFRAGQYISVQFNIEGATLTRPYSICSSPKEALGTENTSYTLMVRQNDNGYVSDYILKNWTEGTTVTLSAPLGEFYFERLRDAKSVVALAGGSGITPFCSMAAAIADGIEDFTLTILYGSRDKDNLLLYDDLQGNVARSNGKVKVIPVFSDKQIDGYEHGFITAELMKKYAPTGDYSVFMCGPRAMYNFADGEISKLSLKRRRVRRELFGEYTNPEKDAAYPIELIDNTYTITVIIRDEEKKVSCKADQTLLSAMEQAGIEAPSHCRSGDCGWCHSLLISGTIYVPDAVDGRRMADTKFGWIHPCCTYPTSDITLEIPSLP